MNPLFKQRGVTPTAALAMRAREQQVITDFKASQTAIRAERNMPAKFEHKNNVQRSMAHVARLNAKKASLGQSVPEVTRPARWQKK